MNGGYPALTPSRSGEPAVFVECEAKRNLGCRCMCVMLVVVFGVMFTWAVGHSETSNVVCDM